MAKANPKGARRLYLTAAAALVGIGALLALVGFAASGFDADLFTARVDMQNGRAILGGMEVADTSNLPVIGYFSSLGKVEIDR